MQLDLVVTNLPLAVLVPYAENARTHSDTQVGQIADSIREFGFVNPVLVDADGVLIAGHGRVLAAKRLGLPETPPAAIPAPAEHPTIVPTPPGSDPNSPVPQTPEAHRAMPQTPPVAPQPAPPVAAAAVVATTSTTTTTASEAVRAERDRIAALGPVLTASRALVPAGTGDALHQRAIAEGWSADALRGALWDAMVQGAKPPAIPASPANTTPAQGDPTVLREAMAEALAVRAMPGYQAQDGGRHAEFLGWRPSEMVAELMRARGERTVPRDTAKLAERAFQTTSDFPLLLSAAANKMLLAAYQPAQPTYRTLFLRRDFRDFKPHRQLRIGDFPNLVQLSENGEIQAGPGPRVVCDVQQRKQLPGRRGGRAELHLRLHAGDRRPVRRAAGRHSDDPSGSSGGVVKRHRVLVKPLRQCADPATIGLSDDTARTDFRARIIAQRAAVGTRRTLTEPRAAARTNNMTGARS